MLNGYNKELKAITRKELTVKTLTINTNPENWDINTRLQTNTTVSGSKVKSSPAFLKGSTQSFSPWMTDRSLTPKEIKVGLTFSLGT